MSIRLKGPQTVSMSCDVDGHREYKVTSLVYSDDDEPFGPVEAIGCVDLARPGDFWLFETGDSQEVDVNAYCTQVANVRPLVSKEGDPANHYLVEQTFSTKCSDYRCKTEELLQPVDIPDRISGSSVKYTEEATYHGADGPLDANGIPIPRAGSRIVNSAHEPLRGPQNEWDKSRSSVKITQNVWNPQLKLCQSLVNCVNELEMWGFPPRCVKLSEFSYERKACGDCVYYYERTLTFDFDVRTWDRDLLDEGTKVLHGEWDRTNGGWNRTLPAGEAGPLNPDLAGNLDANNPLCPNPADPTHFQVYKDKKNEPTRVIYAEKDANGVFGVPFIDPASVAIQWWCLELPNGARQVEQTGGNAKRCSDLRALAGLWGASLSGPYDTQAAAQAVCALPAIIPDPDIVGPILVAGVPWDVICGDSAGSPNKVHVRVYPNARFEVLQIPVAIGD